MPWRTWLRSLTDAFFVEVGALFNVDILMRKRGRPLCSRRVWWECGSGCVAMGVLFLYVDVLAREEGLCTVGVRGGGGGVIFICRCPGEGGRRPLYNKSVW